jgi:hypothetical protein
MNPISALFSPRPTPCAPLTALEARTASSSCAADARIGTRVGTSPSAASAVGSSTGSGSSVGEGSGGSGKNDSGLDGSDATVREYALRAACRQDRSRWEGEAAVWNGGRGRQQRPCDGFLTRTLSVILYPAATPPTYVPLSPG